MLSRETVTPNDSILPHVVPGSLSEGIVHDSNSILTGIMGHVELALLKLIDGSPARDHLQQVLTGCLRVQYLVRQSEVGGHAISQRWKSVELREMVEELLGLLRPSFPHTTRIYLNLGCFPSTILAVHSQIYQVLLNLFTNAGEAMTETGGILLIAIKQVMVPASLTRKYPVLKQGPHVQLTVRDTGHGVIPGVQARIFEPLYSTKRVREGTGVDLGSVQAIIRNHGGEIQIDSAFGRGMTSTIYLPCISEELRSNNEECEVSAR